MPRFSLSAIVLVTTLIAVVAIEFVAAHQSSVVNTGNTFNITISGKGYFCLLDPESGENRFTRSGQLGINENGNVVIRVGESDLCIEPELYFPEGARDICIDSSGRFYVFLDSELQAYGQIQLCLVDDHVNPNDRLNLIRYTGRGYSSNLPGTFGAGHVLQGSLEQPRYAPHRAEAAVLVLGAVAAWLCSRLCPNRVIPAQEL